MTKRKIIAVASILIIFVLMGVAYYSLQPSKQESNLSESIVNDTYQIRIGEGYKLNLEKEEKEDLVRAQEIREVYTVSKGLKKLGTLVITTRKLDNGDIFVYQEMQYKVNEEITVPVEIVINNADKYDFFEIAEEVEREHDNVFGIDMTTNVRGLYEFEKEGNLTSNLLLSQNYVSRAMQMEYDNGEISRIRELKEENKEYDVIENEDGFIIKNGMKLLPEADNSESWFLISNEKLISEEATKESYKNETNHYFVHSTKWQVSDGNYSKLPWSIEPAAKMGYGRNLVALIDRTALDYYTETQDRLFYDLVVTSVNNVLKFKGNKNLWETEYTSTWLKNSYGIVAPYVDTRHNENIALFLTKAGEILDIEEIKDGAVNYADFLSQQKEIGNIIETENGYYIADYYSETASKKTHVSLNHALGEANFLMEAAVNHNNQSYVETALEIYDAVQDNANAWIKEDGDLWYQVNGEGEFYGTDYEILTLEDLAYSMTILKDRLLLDQYPMLEKLLLSKLQFVISNNYSIPKLSVDRIINLGYGEYLEGYEHILEF